jgi:DNA primase
VPDARVSTPLEWSEIPDCDPADFTTRTVPARLAELGDLHAGMDGAVGSLEALLELAARDEAEGLADAPWPPHFQKTDGESTRVAP